jgi:subtilisin family serine protease
MGVLLVLALVASVAAPPVAIAQQAGPADPAEPPVPHEVLVRFEDEAGAGEREAARRAAGTDLEDVLPLRALQLVDPKPGVSVGEAVARLERSPHVLYAEPDLPRVATAMANDSYFGLLWALHNTGQSIGGRSGTADADIDAPEAWDNAMGSSDIAIAIVDSGVDYAHPDLQSNIWRNPGESGGGRESNGADDDGNGLIDDWRGWDWVDSDNAPADLHGHGTHVAGTAGARGGDAFGVTGVAWQVGIVPLRVLDAEGSGFVSDVISAYSYAHRQGIEIVNASLGGDSPSQAERDAIAAAPGTLFVVAAGNEGANNDLTGSFPCNHPLANVICVGASDQDDTLAGFSNYGVLSVDLAAPGVDIASTYPGGGWVYMDGTSMATPHVSGAAALVWSRDPGAPAAGVRQTLFASVDPKPSLVGKTLTGGRLNAARALALSPRAVAPPDLGTGTSPPPAPSGPPPPSPAPPAAPHTPGGAAGAPSRLSLRVARRLSLLRVLRRGLRVRLRCTAPCTFSVELRRGRRPVARTRGRLRAAGSRTVTVRLTARARRSLRRVRSVRLRLRVLAVDQSANRTTAARSLLLTR